MADESWETIKLRALLGDSTLDSSMRDRFQGELERQEKIINERSKE